MSDWAQEKIKARNQVALYGVLVVFIALGIIIIGMFVLPLYSVWQQGLRGQATLARAEQERKILVEQAKAEKESSAIRAEAIATIGEAAQKYPEYRLQEFLGAFAEALQSDKIEKIIYVPTEANIPIMEASRLNLAGE